MKKRNVLKGLGIGVLATTSLWTSNAQAFSLMEIVVSRTLTGTVRAYPKCGDHPCYEDIVIPAGGQGNFYFLQKDSIRFEDLNGGADDVQAYVSWNLPWTGSGPVSLDQLDSLEYPGQYYIRNDHPTDALTLVGVPYEAAHGDPTWKCRGFDYVEQGCYEIIVDGGEFSPEFELYRREALASLPVVNGMSGDYDLYYKHPENGWMSVESYPMVYYTGTYKLTPKSSNVGIKVRIPYHPEAMAAAVVAEAGHDNTNPNNVSMTTSLMKESFKKGVSESSFQNPKIQESLLKKTTIMLNNVDERDASIADRKTSNFEMLATKMPEFKELTDETSQLFAELSAYRSLVAMREAEAFKQLAEKMPEEDRKAFFRQIYAMFERMDNNVNRAEQATDRDLDRMSTNLAKQARNIQKREATKKVATLNTPQQELEENQSELEKTFPGTIEYESVKDWAEDHSKSDFRTL